MSKLIDNYIYFYHLDKFCVIPVYPESITDEMGANFAKTEALARTAPVFTYQNSGPRSMSITLNLHRDLMNDVNEGISNLKTRTDADMVPLADYKAVQGSTETIRDYDYDYIDLLTKHLQAAAVPKYNVYKEGNKGVEPPMVALRIGNDIFVKGVITSSIQVTYKLPINKNNKYMQVTLGFTISETDPYDAESIVSKGSFRGMTATNTLFEQ